MLLEPHRTTSHGMIRLWAEIRGGHPAAVVGATANGDNPGGLRFDFGDVSPGLKRVTWDEFFRTFDQNNLEFVYLDGTHDGLPSPLCRFEKVQ